MYFCARRCQAVSGEFDALKTRKIYYPGYVYKPNVSAEIWGVLLKTGGSMRIFAFSLPCCLPMQACCVAAGLMASGVVAFANDKNCLRGRGVICQCMMGWRYRCMP